MTVNSIDRRSALWATILGLFLALVAPLLTYLIMQAVYGSRQSPGRTELGIVIHWLNCAAVIAIVLLAERKPLSSIGIRSLKWWTVPFGVLAGAVIVVASAAVQQVFRLKSDETLVSSLLSLSFITRLLIVVTAGVFEETLYRGYAIERLAPFCGPWVAGALSLIVFTLMHAPAVGWAALASVALVGFLVTLLYLWRRNLVLNMVAHATIDAIGLLLIPMVGR